MRVRKTMKGKEYILTRNRKKVMDFINSYFGTKLHALSNLEIEKYAKKFKIPNWRGVFMRDTLPKKIRKNECAVINLDSVRNAGTHWTCFYKYGNIVHYFDSFGVEPPPELIQYFGEKSTIFYNCEKFQEIEAVICGQLCLLFLISKTSL